MMGLNVETGIYLTNILNEVRVNGPLRHPALFLGIHEPYDRTAKAGTALLNIIPANDVNLQ